MERFATKYALQIGTSAENGENNFERIWSIESTVATTIEVEDYYFAPYYPQTYVCF